MPAPSQPSVSDRLSAVAKRLAAAEGTRKWYRLGIVLRPHGDARPPAPFSSVSVSTRATADTPSRPFTFAEKTEPIVPDERDPQFKSRRIERRGAYAKMTAAEVEAVKARMGDYVVRWRGKDADILDAAIPSVMESIDPTTDEPLTPYLTIEGPFDAIP